MCLSTFSHFILANIMYFYARIIIYCIAILKTIQSLSNITIFSVNGYDINSRILNEPRIFLPYNIYFFINILFEV